MLGAVVDLGSFGLTAGAGTLGGFALGGSAGLAIGGIVENWTNEKSFVERGEAFDFLYKYQHKQSRLANPALINGILDTLPTWDKNDDGRKWYEMKTLKILAHASEKKLALIRERELREEQRAREEQRGQAPDEPRTGSQIQQHPPYRPLRPRGQKREDT